MSALRDGLGGQPGLSGIEEQMDLSVLFSTDNRIYFRDAALHIYSSTDGQLDITADTMIQLSGKLGLDLSSGAASASGLLMGTGTSGSPATTAAAGNMFAEFRTQSTATSGDSRGLYWRHELKGTAVSGEAIRAFTKLSAACATARGAHISLDLNNSPQGSVTGLGAGIDAQLLLSNTALPAGGTYTVVNAEIYSAGTTTDPGAVTELSYFRVVNGGDSTGAADVDDDAYLFSVQGFSEGTGNMFSAGADVAAAATLKCKVGATEYFVLLATGESN